MLERGNDFFSSPRCGGGVMRSMTMGGLAGEYKTRCKTPLRRYAPPPPQRAEEKVRWFS